MSDTPDARPAGETVAVLLGQIRAQVCCCEDAAECGPLEQISAARAEMDRLLDAYRDAVAAEARAALLAGAPAVWVATDHDMSVSMLSDVQPTMVGGLAFIDSNAKSAMLNRSPVLVPPSRTSPTFS